MVHALIRPLRNDRVLVRLLLTREQSTRPVLRRMDVRRPLGHLRGVLQPKHHLTESLRTLELITKPCWMSHDRGGGDVTVLLLLLVAPDVGILFNQTPFGEGEISSGQGKSWRAVFDGF